jgi:hypothetical protein
MTYLRKSWMPIMPCQASGLNAAAMCIPAEAISQRPHLLTTLLVDPQISVAGSSRAPHSNCLAACKV